MSESKQRTKIVKFWVSESEHEALLERCGDRTLASWVRWYALGADAVERPKKVSVPSSRRQIAPADPDLIAAINRIGNNLNQLTRTVHSAGLNDEKAILLIGQLSDIEVQLSGVLEIEINRNAS